jgi:hypothetical protein
MLPFQNSVEHETVIKMGTYYKTNLNHRYSGVHIFKLYAPVILTGKVNGSLLTLLH